jgi:hypothetical protein
MEQRLKELTEKGVSREEAADGSQEDLGSLTGVQHDSCHHGTSRLPPRHRPRQTSFKGIMQTINAF